jgi:Domain of unknown function (DUF4391)
VTTQADIFAAVDALGLPKAARVELRVPKKLLVEQGAPTSADRRAIQDGIDELQWLGACKPATIGVPSFADDHREYLEIAVVGCAFRPEAKSGRLIELIHRAIPYPVVLITSDGQGITLSVAHKRRAQNEAGKVVVDRVVFAGGLHVRQHGDLENAFLGSLALAEQPRRDLFALYEAWLARIEALNAARLVGALAVTNDPVLIGRRRAALEAHARLTRELIALRAKANREKQLSRRVHLNLEIQRLAASISELTNAM